MGLWTHTLEWWALVNRAAVIRAAAQFAEDGGVLVLEGPPGFGHIEAASFAVRELRRSGWRCHDLATDGPLDAERVAILGMESTFPTAAGGISQAAQLSGLGVSLLTRHIQLAFADHGRRECWVVPYVDATAAMERVDIDFLASIASGSLALVLTSVGGTAWSSSANIEVVELTGFLTKHVELCLARGARLVGFEPEELGTALDEVRLPDGTVLPVAAYTWMQQVSIATGA